jgi:hypothetical protein
MILEQLKSIGISDEMAHDIIRDHIAKDVAVPCEIWSRCVGYFRPLSQWNPGKQSEFWDRKLYNVPYSRHQENA